MLGITLISCDSHAPVQHSFKGGFVHLYLLMCVWGWLQHGADRQRQEEHARFPSRWNQCHL